MLKFFVWLPLVLVMSLSTVSAQAPDVVVSACFDTLKAQALDIADFSLAQSELADLDYAKVAPLLSRYYQGRSSFGIDLEKSLFDTRIYSFGRQTGYIHPPYSPFPVGTQSEQWKFPAKEFILAEEYVRRPDGDREFLGCGIFRIAARDLSAVTRENYLYDGEITSIMTENAGNKLWYNFNSSYDHEDQLLANWYRLFVYPQATQNSYFSRFEVLDSFPGKKLENFSILSTEGIAARLAEGGEFPELEPTVVEGPFFLNGYYQAIVNRFPDFGKQLALRGFLEYENLQKLLASPNAAEANYVWDAVLDARDITTYSLAKSQGKTVEAMPLFDSVLANPGKVNDDMASLALTENTVNDPAQPAVVNPKTVAKTGLPFGQTPFNTFIMVIGLLVLLFVLIGIMVFFTQKRR